MPTGVQTCEGCGWEFTRSRGTTCAAREVSPLSTPYRCDECRHPRLGHRFHCLSCAAMDAPGWCEVAGCGCQWYVNRVEDWQDEIYAAAEVSS